MSQPTGSLLLDCEARGARWAEIVLGAAEAVSLGPRPRVEEEGGESFRCQLDPLPGGGAELIVDLAGREPSRLIVAAASGDAAAGSATDGSGGTAARAGGTGAAKEGEVSVAALDDHQGQESYRIETDGASWVYHRRGGGFASLFDRDGNDWLSFRPWGGSDGIYRGIPNLAHPENVFHPGADTCVTDAPRVGPLRVSVESRAKGDDWACRWHLYPDHAELSVLKVAHPYWLLYEGTPWGELDEARDFCLVSDGRRRALAERWDEVLPTPKWIAFGKEGVGRVLWLHSHAPEHAERRDSYWPMEGNMTVFGFGRLGLEKYLEHVPARFTVGLCESDSFDAVSRGIDSASRRALLRRAG